MDSFALLSHVPPPRNVGNALTGTWQGLRVAVFDVWTTGSNVPTPETRGRAYSCVMVPVPGWWPPFLVDRERGERGLADVAVLRDVELESEEFNRAYQVQGADARFVSALLDARMMAWLLDLTRLWGFEARAGHLLARTDLRLPWELPEVLETTKAFLDHIPRALASLYPPSRPDLDGV